MTSIDFSPSGLPEIGVDKLTVLSGDVISKNLAISRDRSRGSEPMNDKGVANCPSLLLIARGHVILTAERNGNDYVSQTPRRSNYVYIYIYYITYLQTVSAIYRKYYVGCMVVTEHQSFIGIISCSLWRIFNRAFWRLRMSPWRCNSIETLSAVSVCCVLGVECEDDDLSPLALVLATVWFTRK